MTRKLVLAALVLVTATFALALTAAYGVRHSEGPTRILALEVSFRDARGSEIHRDRQTFAKYHRVMPILGFWPYEIVADRQLKTGESRRVRFTLPQHLDEAQITSIHLQLRFYEVHDEHEGDLTQAYFVSDPFLQMDVAVPPRN